MLGWDISKKMFWEHYVNFWTDYSQGFPITYVKGYKNVDRLKRKMHEYGCRFLKTEDVIDLPEQIFQTVKVNATPEYRKFKKDRVVDVAGEHLMGDSSASNYIGLTKLSGCYNPNKIQAFRDILESTNDRLIVFYVFNAELQVLREIAQEYTDHISLVNGDTKDLSAYDEYSDSVTLIQYQAGAMGLNLQKARRIVYFTPVRWSDLFEQSKKRIHRLGQESTCFYYQLVTRGSIDERIYATLAQRRDYTDALFAEDYT